MSEKHYFIHDDPWDMSGSEVDDYWYEFIRDQFAMEGWSESYFPWGSCGNCPEPPATEIITGMCLAPKYDGWSACSCGMQVAGYYPHWAYQSHVYLGYNPPVPWNAHYVNGTFHTRGFAFQTPLYPGSLYCGVQFSGGVEWLDVVEVEFEVEYDF
jgi:hypothetical protein